MLSATYEQTQTRAKIVGI